jgi:predicted TIM-barrel fold metal-dependent hydrolase
MSLATLITEPKFDCHCHVLDPVGFPYGTTTPYRPVGQEIGTAAQMAAVFANYGVRNALLVQPNSGYGDDLSAMLAAIRANAGRYKGIAVVPPTISLDELARLKSLGIVGVAFNSTFHSVAYYQGTEPLIGRLVELDMFLQLQFERDQLLGLLPLIECSKVRLLIDHCGRPTIADGVNAAPFQALLALGWTGRASVKLSGYSKFSLSSQPFADTVPFVEALVDAFTLDHCMWASDWPFLRAPERLDYGPLLGLAAQLFPEPADRHKLFWNTPRRLFGFGERDCQIS